MIQHTDTQVESDTHSPTAGASYESPNRISGAEYARLPQNVSSFWPGENLLLNPKSVSLTRPSFSKNTTFSGFKSLCVCHERRLWELRKELPAVCVLSMLTCALRAADDNT